VGGGIAVQQSECGDDAVDRVRGAMTTIHQGGAIPRHIGYKPAVTHVERDRSMSLLISVLVTFLVVILVLYLVNMLPVDGRAKQIIRIIVIIIGVLSLLRALSVGIY
jgi:hypothetical protein